MSKGHFGASSGAATKRKSAQFITGTQSESLNNKFISNVAITEEKIFGRVYDLVSSDTSSEELTSLARELDQKMHALAKQKNDINPQRIAVLTALNVLQENLHLKKQLADILPLRPE